MSVYPLTRRNSPIGKSTRLDFIETTSLVKGRTWKTHENYLRSRKTFLHSFLIQTASRNNSGIKNLEMGFDVEAYFELCYQLSWFSFSCCSPSELLQLVPNVEGQHCVSLPITSNTKIYSLFDGFIRTRQRNNHFYQITCRHNK